MKKTFITISILIFTNIVFGQYNINVHIDNLKDSTIYLGYYYGDKQYAKDTITLNNKGNGTFEGTDTLPGGIYFILVPNNMFFELLIDKEQKFSIKTEYDKDNKELLNDKLSAKGNSDMDMYIDYQKFMSQKGKLAMGLRKRLKKGISDSEKQIITDSLNLLKNEVKAHWEYIEKNYPKTILASILLCNKDIEVPDPPKDENGVIIDSSFQYKYYKKHYFDYVDFSDDRLLRTQFYHAKVDRYFEKLVIPIPDSIIKESKWILDKASVNDDVFKYTLQMLFNKYNNSNIMGMDKVFVFYADNYYLNGKADWADSTWLAKVRKRTNDLKPNLIGNKAPELQLLDTSDGFVSLYTIEAKYTILFFFEPNCGHCKKATPIMKKLSDKYWEYGVEVLGIYTQNDKKEWIRFIKSQNLDNWINAWDPYNQSNFRHKYDVTATPTIYLLDKDKNIIGKRIDVETVDKILKDRLKIKD
jgi:peroxiredoxin